MLSIVLLFLSIRISENKLTFVTWLDRRHDHHRTGVLAFGPANWPSIFNSVWLIQPVWPRINYARYHTRLLKRTHQSNELLQTMPLKCIKITLWTGTIESEGKIHHFQDVLQFILNNCLGKLSKSTDLACRNTIKLIKLWMDQFDQQAQLAQETVSATPT